MRKKKPAAAIANCPARRAIRRETGRGISSSHTLRTQPRAITRELMLQTSPAGHIPHDRPGLDALYAHHRTAPHARAAREPTGNLAEDTGSHIIAMVERYYRRRCGACRMGLGFFF